jgi:hypothetical protein
VNLGSFKWLALPALLLVGVLSPPCQRPASSDPTPCGTPCTPPPGVTTCKCKNPDGPGCVLKVTAVTAPPTQTIAVTLTWAGGTKSQSSLGSVTVDTGLLGVPYIDCHTVVTITVVVGIEPECCTFTTTATPFDSPICTTCP